MNVVSGATVNVSFVIFGRPSPFRMFMMSYIFNEKFSSLIQADMMVSELLVSSSSFISIVYCLPSTRASMFEFE